MNRRIIFRADAGKNIGFGHFVRSLALAEYLHKDFECIFCTFNPELHTASDYQLSEIKKVCQYLHIQAVSLEEYDKAFLDSLTGNEIVVLDNYYFKSEYQRKVKGKGCRLVCIDDVHDRHMVADVVITVCPIRREEFSLEEYTKFYGGIEWSFLRSPFLKANIARKASQRIQSIVIGVGGADPFGLTNKLINIVKSINDEIELSVIAGDTVIISSELIDKINLYKRLSADEIVNLFAKSDLGVFPASTICIEAFSQKLPVAAGWYVDNQKDFYNEGVKEGWFFPLGSFLDPSEILSHRLKKIISTPPTTPIVNIDFVGQREKIKNIFKDL